MIVFQPSKLKFYPIDAKFNDSTFIELRTIFGKLIYRIEKRGPDLIMERPNLRAGYRFRGNWDYLKIHRCTDPLIDCFKVELNCPNCSDLVYKLTGKLPLVFKIKTDFYVEKDSSKG